MKSGWLIYFCATIAIATAAPARAEKLTFDHRTYPPLLVSLESGNKEMMLYDDHNPRYVYDLVVVQGRSASDWREGLEIITRVTASKMATAHAWMQEMQSKAQPGCAHEYTSLAQDENSITFQRRSTGCPQSVAQTGLYRIVAGKKSLFLLGALYKGEMSEAMRRQWLDLLATAHLTN